MQGVREVWYNFVARIKVLLRVSSRHGTHNMSLPLRSFFIDAFRPTLNTPQQPCETLLIGYLLNDWVFDPHR